MAKKTAKRSRSKNKVNDLAAVLAQTSASPMVRTVEPESGTIMSPNQMVSMFLGLLVVNAVVVGFANWLFPTQVVLGTYQLNYWMSLGYSMVVLTLILVGLMPIIELVAQQAKIKLTDAHWMGLYWLMNAAGLWVVGRFADQLGLGLSSWFVAVVLGAVLDGVQGLVVVKLLMPKSK